MLCLGVESSCDETALALVKNGRLLGQALASQARLHALFNGVVPELASREHYRFIGPLFDKLMRETGLTSARIKGVAVARGPGLLGSLLVGVAFAKSLALCLDVPLVGVDHLRAHLLAVGLEREPEFPALGLLISGGHTVLYRVESPDRFIELGRCLDDAAGEAFDKTGRALGLAYPAGKEIDDLARARTPARGFLPRPYIANDNLDFSFSGLKTTAINAAAALPANDKDALCDFCAAFNRAAAETLRIKTARALDRNPDLRRLWVAGGVAANSIIRETLGELAASRGIEIRFPSPEFCADNAAMIAYAGELLLNMGRGHNLDLEAIPRGKKIPDDHVARTN